MVPWSCSLVAAGMSAVVVGQYRSLAADGFDPGAMRALAESPAIQIMFGKPVALDDPGGFTVWRTGTSAGGVGGGLVGADRGADHPR